MAEAEGEVAAPDKTKEQLEAEQEQQLAALRVLYAAQHAVKHVNESCGTAPCGIEDRESAKSVRQGEDRDIQQRYRQRAYETAQHKQTETQ